MQRGWEWKCQRRFVCVDLSQLNQATDVTAADMSITVRAGCTWTQLHPAQHGTGLALPNAWPLR